METTESTTSNGAGAQPPLGGGGLAVPRDESRHRARERRRRAGRFARRGIVALALVAATAAAIVALRPSAAPVDVATVRRGTLEVIVEESGVSRVKDRYTLSAPVGGTMARVRMEAGDPVAEGDPLIEIASVTSPLLDERTRAETEGRVGAAVSALGQARAQIARAAAARGLAEQELARVRKLAGGGAATAQAVDQATFNELMRAGELASAQFAAKIAQEEVRVARAALVREGGRSGDRHLDVMAPVSGRVLRVHRKSAGVVPAGAALLEIGDPRALEIVVDFLTTDAVHVHPGTPAAIVGWGGATALGGRVRYVEPSAFTRPSALGVDEQRVNVVIALTDPPERWSTLGDGYRVRARLVLWRGERVLQVPQGAVFRRGDAWAVFRIDGGVARLTPVTIGHRGETTVEVLSGLEPGGVVAVHPGDRVKDDARVEIRGSSS